jgi:hypothetical protein
LDFSNYQGNSPDPPEPGELEASMWRGNKLQYTEFTDRMIQAVHRKSPYSEKAADTLFGSLVSPSQQVSKSASQQAFTMILYKNGFQKWVWMHNGSVSSGASKASNGDTLDISYSKNK